MGCKLAITLAAVSLGLAALPTGVMAHGMGGHGGGGHGFSGGFGGHSFSGGFGGHSFSGHNFSGHNFSNPGGASVFMHHGMHNYSVPGGAKNFNAPRSLMSHGVPGRVSGHGRYAWIGHHRIHGRHLYGLLPGIGYAWYWYYDDCSAWTDYGWVNLCGDDDY